MDRSALMHACWLGHYEVASLLVEKGAQLDLQESSGESVLTGAEYNRHFRAEECFLKNIPSCPVDMSFYALDEVSLTSPLENSNFSELEIKEEGKFTVMKRSHTSTSLSLQGSSDPEQKEALDGGGVMGEAQLPDTSSSPDEWAFFSACKQGQYEVARALLEKRPCVNLQDGEGWSALMCVCQEGHLEVAKFLLENGAMIDLQNSKGWSALMLACQEGRSDVAKLLLDYGADFNLQSLKWESAYNVAMLNDDQEIGALMEEVRRLLEHVLECDSLL